MTNYWLFKTEPDEFSLSDLEQKGVARWDGIRNYGARNFLRDQVKVNDLVLIYHSSCANVGVVGLAKVVAGAYPDPTQFDPNSLYFDPKSEPGAPRWVSVDIAFVEAFKRFIPLATIKKHPDLSAMVLIKQPRLSVQPVSNEEFQILTRLAG